MAEAFSESLQYESVKPRSGKSQLQSKDKPVERKFFHRWKHNRHFAPRKFSGSVLCARTDVLKISCKKHQCYSIRPSRSRIDD